MSGDERLELGHHVGGGAELELGLDSVLERRGAERLESHALILREGLVDELGERGAPPEGQRIAKVLGRLGIPALFECGAAGGTPTLEAVEVDGVGGNSELVAGGTRTERALG